MRTDSLMEFRWLLARGGQPGHPSSAAISANPYITRRFANGVSFRAIGSPVSASRKARRLGWAPSRRALEEKWVAACEPMLGRNDGEQNVRFHFGGNNDLHSG